MLNTYSLSNISIITPQQFLKKGNIKISKNKIESIDNKENKAKYNIDIPGNLYLYPALINVHDHLRGNYLPKVGPKPGSFYLNWLEWDNELKAAPVYIEREKNSTEDLYLLSAYKNLFSGVVTVNDHFPHEINDLYIYQLPVRVINDYALSHTCDSLGLKWGEGIEREHKKAIAGNIPFITHCEEGFDEETQSGLDKLEALHSLDEHDILIHCIGFSDKDIRKVKEAGATIVWCPGSNIFMFNVTCKIRKILKAGINTCIGSDATHSGSINLFEEIKLAKRVYQKMYNTPLSDKKVFEMITINPAKAFKMEDKIGSLETGKWADLLLLNPKHRDPYTALVNAGFGDIELLVLAGNPLLGTVQFEDLFKERGVDYTRISIHNREMLVKGDPVMLMRKIRKAVNYKKQLDFIPIDEYIYNQEKK